MTGRADRKSLEHNEDGKRRRILNHTICCSAVIVSRAVDSGSELQLRRQHGVRLGLDLPDYIPLPSTDARPPCCDVLSTTSHQNVDEPPPDASSPEERGRGTGRLAMTAEILRQLRLIVARMDETGRRRDVIAEWRQVAVVIDRLLFRVFLTTTVISSVIVLVLVPLYSHPR